MAKLRDSEVKDTLNVAGSITSKGKALVTEGHTHTPEEITGLKEYIKTNSGGSGSGSTSGSSENTGGTVTLPENINAKTLDGHTVDEFALKTDVMRTSRYIVDKSVYDNFWSKCVKITLNNTPADTFIIVEDLIYKLVLDRNGRLLDFTLKSPVSDDIFNDSRKVPTISSSRNIVYIRGMGTFNYGNIGFVDIKVIGSDNTAHDSITIETVPQNSSNLGNYTYLDINKNISNAIHHASEIKWSLTELSAAKYVIKPRYLDRYRNGNALAIPSGGESYVVDLKSGKYIRTYSNMITSNIERANAKIVRAYGLFFLINLSMFESINDIVVFSQFAINLDKNIDRLDSISYTYQNDQLSNNSNLTIEKFREMFNYGKASQSAEINCKINGIPFNGKDDITIPGSTNATTLDGLSSSQFIKATDVMAGTGKIPRFDAQGFLVYPDGSKERIENV